MDEGGVGMSEQSGEVDFALAAFREEQTEAVLAAPDPAA